MRGNGFKMNHSTVRNIFITSLIKVATELTTLYGLKLNAKQIKNIAIDPRFQDAVKIFMSTNKHDRL